MGRTQFPSERRQTGEVPDQVEERQPQHTGHQVPQSHVSRPQGAGSHRLDGHQGRNEQRGQHQDVQPEREPERLHPVAPPRHHPHHAHQRRADRSEQAQVGDPDTPQTHPGQTGQQVVGGAHEAGHQPTQHHRGPRRRPETPIGDRTSQQIAEHCTDLGQENQHRPESEERGGDEKVGQGDLVAAAGVVLLVAGVIGHRERAAA